MWETIIIAIVVAVAVAYLLRRTWISASKGDGRCDGGCDTCAARGGLPDCPPEAPEESEETPTDR